MVARQSSALRFIDTLPRRSVLPHLWPDRSETDCRMDPGRQTGCPVSTSDAQVHLDADTTRSVTMRARLTKDFTFEAAQTLPSAPEGHKCRKMHGHSFKIEVSVEGEVDP